MKEIKLQGIPGEKKGIPTKKLKKGDVIIWNFGYQSEVVKITPSKTGKTITFTLRSLEDGQTRERRMGADRLVVIKQNETPKNPIEKAIAGREKTINGIYSDIGTALDDFTTSELVEYYIERFGSGVLRDFVEQQIIAAEISKEKAAI